MIPAPFIAVADQAARSGHWTPGRKEAVLVALRRRELTPDEACARWGLTLDELRGWQERFRASGRKGLAVTKIQEVRSHG